MSPEGCAEGCLDLVHGCVPVAVLVAAPGGHAAGGGGGGGAVGLVHEGGPGAQPAAPAAVEVGGGQGRVQGAQRVLVAGAVQALIPKRPHINYDQLLIK